MLNRQRTGGSRLMPVVQLRFASGSGRNQRHRIWHCWQEPVDTRRGATLASHMSLELDALQLYELPSHPHRFSGSLLQHAFQLHRQLVGDLAALQIFIPRPGRFPHHRIRRPAATSHAGGQPAIWHVRLSSCSNLQGGLHRCLHRVF